MSIQPAKVKVFCIGFQKTGTKSMAQALRMLGYAVTGPNGVEVGDVSRVRREMVPRLVERFDAFQDNPWPLLYEEMDHMFPGSKFVLTLRDTDDWMRSMVAHFGERVGVGKEWIYGYGAPMGHESEYKSRYEDHNQKVVEYFKGRDDQLLVMDLTKGDGWDKLCPFLCKPIPDAPFPRENSAEKRKRTRIGGIGRRVARRLRQVALHSGRDLYNLLCFGRRAPKKFELIWVDPLMVKRYVPNKEIVRVTGQNRNRASGRVIDWSMITEVRDVCTQKKLDLSTKHWLEGHSWESLGYRELMSKTNKWGQCSPSEVQKRIDKLDNLFENTRMSRRLKTRKELSPDSFREQGGILIHIGTNGEPVFGGHGNHRLAIARVLQLKRIPACLGVVDSRSLDHLEEYRRNAR
jgi:hypothetical protein